MIGWDAWKPTDETVLEQFREYLGVETSLDFECLELSAKGSFHLWFKDIQREVEGCAMVPEYAMGILVIALVVQIAHSVNDRGRAVLRQWSKKNESYDRMNRTGYQ